MVSDASDPRARPFVAFFSMQDDNHSEDFFVQVYTAFNNTLKTLRSQTSLYGVLISELYVISACNSERLLYLLVHFAVVFACWESPYSFVRTTKPNFYT